MLKRRPEQTKVLDKELLLPIPSKYRDTSNLGRGKRPRDADSAGSA